MSGPVSGLWRSEDMVLVQMHMQREIAHDTVLKVGDFGMVEFVDLNRGATAFSRTFSNEIRRCDDIERRLRYFSEQLAKAELNVTTSGDPQYKFSETLDALESLLEEREVELKDLTQKYEQLAQEMNRNREYYEVLARDERFYQGHTDQLLDRGNLQSAGGLGFVTGVIASNKFDAFKRLIFRATRGNTFLRSDPIAEAFPDPATGERIQKEVFVVFFSAQRAREKIEKLCESMQATVYAAAEGNQIRARNEVEAQMASLDVTLSQTKSRRNEVLTRIAVNFNTWKKYVVVEKSVYHIMNMLQFKGMTVVAEAWTPVIEYEKLLKIIKDAEAGAGAQVNTLVNILQTKEKHPTYFKTNRFTECFQGIVDSYGIARYKEVNPGVLTIITFPYLFGIMYGDIGHGILMTIFAAILVIREKSFLGEPMNEIFALIFGGRYLILLMGLFATYVGILYNDMFGISTEIFPSSYTWPSIEGWTAPVMKPTSPSGSGPGYNVKPSQTIMFGIDGAWAETENKLEFYNSVKMKCAIIIGVIQMLTGLVLSLMNHIYFKDWKHVIFGFIPEVMFLMCTFGYMAIIIVVKWCTQWPSTHDAPSLLETMTNFFLAPGTVPVPLYAGQGTIQAALLVIAFLMVPLMLIPIPYLEWRDHKKRMQSRLSSAPLNCIYDEDNSHHIADSSDDEEFDFSEIVIHQVIHTIEFVLGCVSNTASYLRLWALSLAHAELSEVFWNFALMMTVGLDKGYGVILFIGFGIWFGATIGVLLMMESLSAFLHALRLHWVEFQNKFYAGDGVKFSPYSLHEIMVEAKLSN